MNYSPRIRTACLKAHFKVGKYHAALFVDIESAGKVQYQYVMTLFNEHEQPIMHVSSEVNKFAKEVGGGTHFLGVFENDSHGNLGNSNDWGNEALFVKKALEIMHEKYGDSTKKPQHKKKKKGRTMKRIAGVIIGILIIAGGFVAYPFVDEYMSYRKAINEKTISAMSDYVDQFDNSFATVYNSEHLEKVMFTWVEKEHDPEVMQQYFKVQHYLHQSKKFKRNEEVLYLYCEATKDINKTKLFLWQYPESQYASRLRAQKDSLLHVEVSRVRARLDTLANTKLASFFSNLLTHLANSEVQHVGIQFNPTVKIQDLQDYDEEVIIALDEVTEHPLIENIISLKSNITSKVVNQFESDIGYAIWSSFEQIMDSKVFYVEYNRRYSNKSSHELTFSEGPDDYIAKWASRDYFYALKEQTSINIKIDYTIANTAQTYQGVQYPEIWTYRINGIFESYLLGISTDFTYNFELPDQSSKIHFSDHSDPKGEIKNIENVEEAYTTMVSRTVKKFLKDIRSNINPVATNVIVNR